MQKLYVSLLLTLTSITFLHADTDFLVAIDPGHTKAQYGAISATGVHEYTFNRAVAETVLTALKKEKGVDAFIINPEGGKIALKARTKMAADHNASIFLSLHHDAVKPQYLSTWTVKGKEHRYSDRFSGYSIFVSQKNTQFHKSLDFAKALGEALRNSKLTPTMHHNEKIKGENRELLDKAKGVYRFDDLIVLKTVDLPSVLLECGIIVNRKDEVLLSSEAYKKKIAKAIVTAIETYRKKFQE